MKHKYFTIFLVITLVISTIANVYLLSSCQTLKEDIEGSRNLSIRRFYYEISSIYDYINDWQLKNNDKKELVDYVLYLGIINNKLSNALTLGLTMHDKSIEDELLEFFSRYQKKSQFYSALFSRSLEIQSDEDYIFAESIIDDMLIISKWVMNNRNNSDKIFTIQELKKDGIFDKINSSH